MSDDKTTADPTLHLSSVKPALHNAIREAWDCGYKQAVDTLRELADEFGDEQIKHAVKRLANTLEEMRPVADE